MRYLLVALIFISCSPQQRVTKLAIRYPDKFANPCATLYPVREKENVKEVFVKGETQYQFDTVTIDCDTVYSNKVVRVPVKVASVRVDTFTRELTKTVENTAAISAAQQETKREQDRAAKAEAMADRIKDGRNTWRIISIVCLALILGGIAFKIAKPSIL